MTTSKLDVLFCLFVVACSCYFLYLFILGISPLLLLADDPLQISILYTLIFLLISLCNSEQALLGGGN